MGGVQHMRGIVLMKSHPPVDLGKVSAGKPVKQFQCGKCKKTFPKGQGHNARTCGKNAQHGSGTISTANVSPSTPSTGVKRTTSISEVDTLLQQKLKKGKKVPHKPQRTVGQDGTVRWTLDSKLHNPDGPARVYADGSKEWWVNGKLHRSDGPAIERVNEHKAWYSHDKPHRIDGPAVEYAGRGKKWWVDGIRTKHPDLCEKAVLPDLTDEEFYELCTHKDYVVRQLAAHNPRCPAEWRVLVEIMDG